MNKRELKFRAWTRDKMLYGVWPTGTDSYGVWAARNHPDGSLKELVFVEMGGGGAILLQYTGLKDRNGKEIYEGDVVRFDVVKGDRPQEQSEHQDLIGDVQWNPHGPSFGEWTERYCTNARVIGNIYENPELLK